VIAVPLASDLRITDSTPGAVRARPIGLPDLWATPTSPRDTSADAFLDHSLPERDPHGRGCEGNRLYHRRSPYTQAGIHRAIPGQVLLSDGRVSRVTLDTFQVEKAALPSFIRRVWPGFASRAVRRARGESDAVLRHTFFGIELDQWIFSLVGDVDLRDVQSGIQRFSPGLSTSSDHRQLLKLQPIYHHQCHQAQAESTRSGEVGSGRPRSLSTILRCALSPLKARTYQHFR
jgi:hypothetical protein